MIVNAQHGSTSSLQRRFKIGYSRAGRIMDMLEEKGIVGPQNGSKPREVLVDNSELEQIKALESDDSVTHTKKDSPANPTLILDEDIEEGEILENDEASVNNFKDSDLIEEEIE